MKSPATEILREVDKKTLKILQEWTSLQTDILQKTLGAPVKYQ